MNIYIKNFIKNITKSNEISTAWARMKMRIVASKFENKSKQNMYVEATHAHSVMDNYKKKT